MMIAAKKIAGLVLTLCVGGVAAAQEKVETPSHKTKEAVDTFKAAPRALGKAVQDLGKAAGAKLGVGQGQDETAKAPADAAVASRTDKESAAAKVAVAPVVTRDPFRPFTLNSKPVRPPRENLSPLERYDLGQLKLVGVIWDVKQPSAMVEDAAGLGYVVKIGTPIGSNEGKVKSIQPARLVIEEVQYDVYGAKKLVERSMRLEPEKAE